MQDGAGARPCAELSIDLGAKKTGLKKIMLIKNNK
jgi:hypothetical protein